MRITSEVNTKVKGVRIKIGNHEYKEIDHKDPATALELAVLRDDIKVISFGEVLANDYKIKIKKELKEERKKIVDKIWEGHRKNIKAGEKIAKADMDAKEKDAKEKAVKEKSDREKAAKEKATKEREDFERDARRSDDSVGETGEVENPDSGDWELPE